MKRVITGILIMLVASAALAVTVVLKDGRRIQAAAVEQRGNYFIVRYESGRVESYPMAAVDQEAMRKAAGETPATAPEPVPTEPKSPFARAVSAGGQSKASLSDEDLPGRIAEEVFADEDEVSAEEEGERAPGARVELLGYDYVRVEDGVWDVTVNVVNRGVQGATGVAAVVRLLGDEGEAFGSGSGRMDAVLGSGEEGRIVARVQAEKEPSQVSVSLQWQVIEPEGEITETRERQGRPTPETPLPTREQEPEARFLRRPPGSSPMTLPEDPMALPSPVLQPQPGQVPPPPTPEPQ